MSTSGRCYCNDCQNGGYFEPNYDSPEELAKLDAEFVGPSEPLVFDDSFDDTIPF